MQATCSAPGLQSHTVTWMHRNLPDSSGLFLVILYLRAFHCCHSWCPFLHLSYPTHSLGSCAPRPRLEPVMILKSLNTLPPIHTLPFPECQTGQRFFLPGLHGQFIFAHLFRAPRGPQSPTSAVSGNPTPGFLYYASTISL